MSAKAARRALVAVEAVRGRDAKRGASQVRAALLSNVLQLLVDHPSLLKLGIQL